MKVILFLTHLFNQEVLERFELIETPPGFDKFILLDATSGDAPCHPKLHPFRFADFLRAGYRPLAPYIVPGSPHFPVIEFLAAHAQYSHAWCIEYDAMFRGRWTTFFSAHDSNADLISAYVSKPQSEPLWLWWKTIKGPVSLAEGDLLRSFNPVYRLSSRAAAVLRSEYKAGWVGHFEVTMATLLKLRGMQVEDFGNGGEYCRECNRNRWYDHRTYSHAAFPMERLLNVTDQLVHPIKLRQHASSGPSQVCDEPSRLSWVNLGNSRQATEDPR